MAVVLTDKVSPKLMNALPLSPSLKANSPPIMNGWMQQPLKLTRLTLLL